MESNNGNSRCDRCGVITDIKYELEITIGSNTNNGRKYDLCSTCHEQFELKTYLGTEDFSWMKKNGSS